jgi:pyridoxal phosphate phosphatase PHOSPHO2
MAATTVKRAVVWDWDHSALDDNTDTVVPLVCGGEATLAFIAERSRATPWNALRAETARRLHAGGVTPDAVRAALRTMAMHEDIRRAFHLAREVGAFQYVVSDANAVYISVTAEAHGVAACIDSITTNPAHFDESGLLVIGPHQDAQSPHGCARCPVNLCKGGVLDRLGLSSAQQQLQQQAQQQRPRVLYVGDGNGDLCACLRLGPGDVICAREGYPLLSTLRSAAVAPLVRARVVPWRDGSGVLAAVRAFLEQ